MSEELKPCPFCGGTDLKSAGDDKVVHVYCRTCEATGPNQYDIRHDWNTRATNQQAATIAELRRLIERAKINTDILYINWHNDADQALAKTEHSNG